MTKEELEKEADEWVISNTEIYDDKFGIECEKEPQAKEAYFAGANPREKRIAELEEKISILLSCKNCPDNKGGLLCQKEYEEKCLAQKIQYIKELQEEIAELKSRDCWKSCEYASPKAELIEQHIKDVQNLTKAKEIIKGLLESCFGYNSKSVNYEIKAEAEQFLKEYEV